MQERILIGQKRNRNRNRNKNKNRNETSMIENHLKNIEQSVELIRRELNPPVDAGDVIRVKDQTELQAAIDNAPVNSQILVNPSVVYDSIILRSGQRNITLSSDATLGNGRVSPEWNEALVKVKSFKSEPRAEGYNFTGFNFLPSTPDRSIIVLGSDKETDPLNTPNEILFNQCVIDADIKVGGRRGIQLMCRRVAILNCHLANFWHSNDSQSIGCYNGPGPYLIHNNFMEASGENFISGGADTLNEAMQTTYVEFTNNFCYKPETWKPQANTTVKNLFELKDILSANIQNNLFEGSWKDGQVGYSIVITPRNQNGREPFAIVKDINFSWNVIRNAGAGISILGDDNLQPSLRTENIVIENNLIYDIDPVKHAGSAGRIFAIARSPLNIHISNNTCLGIPKINSFMDIEQVPEQLKVFNNIFTEGSYGLKTAGGLGIGPFVQGTKDSEFNGNYIIPSNIRSINYGQANIKSATCVEESTFRSLVNAGVDIDVLRSKVVF